ncbi:MAG: elongation factor G [Dehalococcoidia bacterium]
MQDFKTEDIRNVILLSHTGAGKTQLAEAMLYNAKVITRLGKVEEGNTVTDFEPEEVKRQSSTSTALAPLEWKNTKINIIDTPGYFDFVGEVKSAMRAADGAIIPICAAAGIEVGTEFSWQYAEENNLPRIIFINKIDRENADFDKVMGEIEEKFGNKCAPIQLPIGSQDDFRGVIDLVTGKPVGDAPGDAISQDEIKSYREKLIESVAESDDDLATKYLEGEEIAEEEINRALLAGTSNNTIVPVMVGSALKNKNISELLDAVCYYLPSPKGKGEVKAGDKSLPPDENAPTAAFVFKTTTDPYVGKMTYLRAFSGSVDSNSTIWNTNKGKAEKVAQLFTVRGKTQEPASRIIAGDIGVLTKLSDTSTGDTLSSQDNPIQFEGIDFPVPTLSCSVNPKTKADVDKMGTALNKIIEEDASLLFHRDPTTAETILTGYGEAQLDVTAEKMKRKFGLETDLATPKIPYKETITVPTKAEYKHKKQTGGHGQYGHVLIDLQPLERGQGYEFEQSIVGGAIPKNYIPAVEKGIAEALNEGLLAGYPVTDLKVILYDGSYHDVDSSDMSFKMAGLHALKKGVNDANPVLLEPIMNVTITIPDAFTGDVMGDLNSRRARISGMNPANGITVITAQAPLSEMQRYSIDLRSMTQGRGSYVNEFSHYEEVPQHLAQNIIDKAATEKGKT